MEEVLIVIAGTNWLAALVVFLTFLFVIDKEEPVSQKDARQAVLFLMLGPIILGAYGIIKYISLPFINLVKIFRALK